MIIVDSRETRSGIPDMLRRLGVETEHQELPRGDYRIGNVEIERKECNDFALSVMDGRLFGQLELLGPDDGIGILIIEGNLATIRSMIVPEALAGALSAIALMFDVRVLPTADATQTAAVLARMEKHHREGLGYEIPLRNGKPRGAALSQFLVEGLPGVGAETARKLIAHFGSPRAVFTASAAQLAGVKGIGPKTVAAIQEALDNPATGFRVRKTAAR